MQNYFSRYGYGAPSYTESTSAGSESSSDRMMTSFDLYEQQPVENSTELTVGLQTVPREAVVKGTDAAK